MAFPLDLELERYFELKRPSDKQHLKWLYFMVYVIRDTLYHELNTSYVSSETYLVDSCVDVCLLSVVPR